MKLSMLLLSLAVLISLAAQASCADDMLNPAPNQDPSLEALKEYAKVATDKDTSSGKGTPWSTSSLSDKYSQSESTVLGQAASSIYENKADLFFDGVSANNVYTITAQDFLAAKAADPNWLVVDMRPSEQYVQGHIPGAMNIPFTELVPLMGTIPSGKKVAVYCASDINAAYGVMTLRVFADLDAWLLLGGVQAWQEAGQPVE
ncbi:MAG: rhodanese-like domain-containing protein [Methanotrichaceae archaeon]|nr:rhodanese-like domain-containing protein [Methanotrichaceae archaeon]